ncbi:hypothetical protein B0T10DRAFT_480077 [Thelonectria olida]|uniref:Uncharacterized protein n=1 Tax=Thelonectria olida TaxID=1576542 RepID=A0A9P9AVF1_9HYPO|nr:hypothetical protein B0T10DRAFT_480077 [Thelonectria olida]
MVAFSWTSTVPLGTAFGSWLLACTGGMTWRASSSPLEKSPPRRESRSKGEGAGRDGGQCWTVMVRNWVEWENWSRLVFEERDKEERWIHGLLYRVIQAHAMAHAEIHCYTWVNIKL